MWEVLVPEVSIQFISENHMEGILAVFLYAKMHFPLLLDTLLIYISQPLSHPHGTMLNEIWRMGCEHNDVIHFQVWAIIGSVELLHVLCSLWGRNVVDFHWEVCTHCIWWTDTRVETSVKTLNVEKAHP